MLNNDTTDLQQYFEKAQNELSESTNLPALPSEDEEVKKLSPTLKSERDKILTELVAAPDSTQLQRQFDLFNLNQAKTDAVRTIKLSGMREKIEDQIYKRITTHPDYIDNKTLIDFYDAVSDQISQIKKQNEELSESTPIKISNDITQVNVNVGPQLDREGRDRVVDFVSMILKKAQEQPIAVEYEDITEGDNTDAT